MKPLLKIRQWLKRRQRVLAGILLPVLLIGGFYVVENVRGGLALDAAVREARAAGLPERVAGIDDPPVPEARNLFLSKVVRNRLILDEHGAFARSGPLVNAIPWGNFQQLYASDGRKSRRVDTSPREGRALDLGAVRNSMGTLGWTLPVGGSAAEAVRAGLDRFKAELEEWASEIRQRPGWSVTEEYAPYIGVIDKMLSETVGVFGVRAVSGAAAGRPSGEVLHDLESVSLLCRHSHQSSGAVNGLVWELLRMRCLNDAELVQAGSLLLEEPATDVLLKAIYTDALSYTDGYLRSRGAGGGPADCLPAYFHNSWGIYLDWPDKIMDVLQPRGWSMLAEAGELRALEATRSQVEATAAAWRAGSPGPGKAILPPLSWWQREWPFNLEHHETLAKHYVKCGCQGFSIVHAALEARVAMVAIGMERYRLRQGGWPEDLQTLGDLIPRGLRSNPQTAKPLVYTPSPDGGWVLEAAGHWVIIWRTAVPL